MPRRPPPTPPYPELVRQPKHGFGWLQAELLHEGWLRELGPHATAVLVLLAIAADRRGSSFYGRDRMASALGMTRHEIDNALDRLLTARLVAIRPWRPGRADGVWQLLPPPPRTDRTRQSRAISAGELLRNLGFMPQGPKTAE